MSFIYANGLILERKNKTHFCFRVMLPFSSLSTEKGRQLATTITGEVVSSHMLPRGESNRPPNRPITESSNCDVTLQCGHNYAHVSLAHTEQRSAKQGTLAKTSLMLAKRFH